MSGIVCAIRGGPASRPTIEKAINLAKETKLPLNFLYVVNLDFLAFTSSSRIHLISKQMREMGEFILITAQSKAQSEGVPANGIVRQGNIREEIISICLETGARYVVLGKPKIQSEEENVFTKEHLDEFALKLKTESGAEIVLTE